jgi:hypothetical protein
MRRGQRSTLMGERRPVRPRQKGAVHQPKYVGGMGIVRERRLRALKKAVDAPQVSGHRQKVCHGTQFDWVSSRSLALGHRHEIAFAAF